MKTMLVALGGNAINKPDEEGNILQQFKHSEETFDQLTDILVTHPHYQFIITHGNGPQIGNIILRSEYSSSYIYPLPLDVCVSDSEGGMGYMFQQTFYNKLKEKRIDQEVVAIVTQTLVDKDDPAFEKPSKPVGRFYGADEAEKLREERGWIIEEDSGRGYRRMIPSPLPLEIIEMKAVQKLVEQGFHLIAAGGGGVPVFRDDQGYLHGVEAVVDKDLASSIIARCLKVDLFVIITAVEKVYLHYNTPRQKPLHRVALHELKEYYRQGMFPPGSMGPKIQAIIQYLEHNPAGKALITTSEKLNSALEGQNGTWFEFKRQEESV